MANIFNFDINSNRIEKNLKITQRKRDIKLQELFEDDSEEQNLSSNFILIHYYFFFQTKSGEDWFNRGCDQYQSCVKGLWNYSRIDVITVSSSCFIIFVAFFTARVYELPLLVRLPTKSQYNVFRHKQLLCDA